MNTYLNKFYLIAAAICLNAVSHTAYASERVEVIKADIERRDVKFDRIDSENFEFSISAGLLVIEDFDTGDILSARLGYHLHENLFVEVSYSISKGDRTSYEEIVTGTTLVTEDERDYTSLDVSLGFNLFPGETWLLGKAYSSDLYLMFGAGETDFVGSKWTTYNIGLGYRLYLTDWLAMRIDVRDHIFNRDIFGEDDQTNNVEMAVGFSYFF